VCSLQIPRIDCWFDTDNFLYADLRLLILPQRAGKVGTPVGMAFPIR